MGLSRRRKKDLEHLALLKLVSVCIQLNLYVYLGFKHTAIFPLCPVFFVSSLKIYTVQSFHPGIKKKQFKELIPIKNYHNIHACNETMQTSDHSCT